MLTVANLTPRLRASPSVFRLPDDLSKGAELRARVIWSGENPGKIDKVVVSDAQLHTRVETVAGLEYVVLEVPANYEVNGRPIVTVVSDEKLTPPVRLTVWKPVAAAARSTAPPRTATGATRLRTTPPAPDE